MQSTAPGRHGWVMVFVGFSLSAMSFGGLGTVGVFLKPLIAEFGWSRGETSLGFSIAALSAAAFGILWGFFADRQPTRRFLLMAAGALAVAQADIAELVNMDSMLAVRREPRDVGLNLDAIFRLGEDHRSARLVPLCWLHNSNNLPNALPL